MLNGAIYTLSLETHHEREFRGTATGCGPRIRRGRVSAKMTLLHQPLASGFVKSRTPSMKSSVARLRERFFKVMTATLSRVFGNSTGRILSDGCRRGSRTQ